MAQRPEMRRQDAILGQQLQRQNAIDCTTDYEMNSIQNTSAKIQIQTHYIEIVRNLRPDEIVDYLYQIGILHNDYCNAIRNERLQADKCRELIHTLLLSQHPTACLSFKDALKFAHAFLIDIMEQPRTPIHRIPDTIKMFNECAKISLRDHIDAILSSVHPDSVLDALITMSIITCADRRRLTSSRPTTNDQLLALWNHLNKTNTPHCFVALKAVLCEEGYDWIFSR